MPAGVVYLDQVLLGSLVMNYAILWVVAKFIRTGCGQGRLLGAAALGSMYSVAVFIPALFGLLTFWHKVLVSVVMVGVGFGWRGPRNFLACLGCFYLVSFTLGGAVWGFISLLQSNSYSGVAGMLSSVDRYFWYGIVLALASFWLAGQKWPSFLRGRAAERNYGVDLTICIMGRQARVPAMVDTGNHLTDPLTGRPVIVAEYNALADVLPAEFRLLTERDGSLDLAKLPESLGNSAWAVRFRPIPFRSLGLDQGMLPGFRPDWVGVKQGESIYRTREVVIAVCCRPLHEHGSYRALIHPDLAAAAVPV